MNASNFLLATSEGIADLDQNYRREDVILAAVAQEEAAANHELVEVQFLVRNRVRLTTKPSFDFDKDGLALAQIVAMIRAEGYKLVSVENPAEQHR